MMEQAVLLPGSDVTDKSQCSLTDERLPALPVFIEGPGISQDSG